MGPGGEGSAERVGEAGAASTRSEAATRTVAMDLSTVIGRLLRDGAAYSLISFSTSSWIAVALAGPLPTRVMRILPFLSMTVTWGIPLTP